MSSLVFLSFFFFLFLFTFYTSLVFLNSSFYGRVFKTDLRFLFLFFTQLAKKSL